MGSDPFSRERAAAEIAAALNRLIDVGVGVGAVREFYENLPSETHDKRLILSLVQPLWPDPDQCPDQC